MNGSSSSIDLELVGHAEGRTSGGMRAGIAEELKKQVSERAKTRSQIVQSRFYECVMSPTTEVGILLLVFFDVVLLLCGVQFNGFAPKRIHWTSICHGALLGVFSFEALCRILAEFFATKVRHLHLLKHGAGTTTNSFLSVLGEVAFTRRFPLSAFVIVDTCLVILGIVGALIWGLQSCATILPSMLRFGRVGQIGPQSRAIFLRPMELIFFTVCDSATVLFSAFSLLLLNLVFFAVWAMGVLQPEIEEHMRDDAIARFGARTVENCRYAFSSLLASMSTLFALSTGDQWHDIAFPIMYFKPWAFMLFMLHSVIACSVIIGLVYGVLHQTLQRFHLRQVQLDESSHVSARQAVLNELKSVFDDIDADGSGYITWQEFHHNRKHNHEFLGIMDKLDLDESELLLIWDIMDTSRDGKVSQEEFVKFMWKILFGEGKWSQLKTMHCAAQSNFKAEETKKYVLDVKEELLVHRRMLERLLERGPEGEDEHLDVVRAGSTDIAERCTTIPVRDGLETVNSADFTGTDYVAIDLMRGVAVDRVTRYGSDDVVTFWGGGSFIDSNSDREFNMSRPCQQCDYFVSHCWAEPEEWHSYFQRNNTLQSYGYMKAVELHNVLCDKVSRRLRRVTTAMSLSADDTTTLWVDKCCIPQNDKKTKAACVALLEGFMKLSDGFLVILSWQYFTRLWCVYEWACFLRTHSPASVELGFDAFLRSDARDTLPLYLHSIENLSVKSARCFLESDHAILEAKVFQYYKGETPEESFESFERFAKCTAICLMAKQIVLWRARGSQDDERAWLEPFRNLANKLGYDKLGKVLSRAQPASWFSQCEKNQEAFDNVVLYWFDNDCVQYLIQERLRAVRKFRKNRESDTPILEVESLGFGDLESKLALQRTPIEFASIQEVDVIGESYEFEVVPPTPSAQPNFTPRGLKPRSKWGQGLLG